MTANGNALLLEYRADGAAHAPVTDTMACLRSAGGAAHGNAMLVRATPFQHAQ